MLGVHKKKIPFIVTFSRCTFELHKLYSEPAMRCSLVVPAASSSLPGHKSLDEDVNEYLSFRSVEASSCLNPAGDLAMVPFF